MTILARNNSEDLTLNNLIMERNRFKDVIGFLLLTPALISILLFFLQLMGINSLKAFEDSSWTGSWGAFGNGGGGFLSALPIYFGLMAIAGSYLVSNSKKDDGKG